MSEAVIPTNMVNILILNANVKISKTNMVAIILESINIMG